MEVKLDFPIEVKGKRYETLAFRNIATFRGGRSGNLRSQMAHVFGVPHAVIDEIDSVDEEKIIAAIDDFCAKHGRVK